MDYRRIWPLKPKTCIIIGSESINQPQDYYGVGVAKLGVTGVYPDSGIGPVSVSISVPLAQHSLGFLIIRFLRKDGRSNKKLNRTTALVTECSESHVRYLKLKIGVRNIRQVFFLVKRGGS